MNVTCNTKEFTVKFLEQFLVAGLPIPTNLARTKSDYVCFLNMVAGLLLVYQL